MKLPKLLGTVAVALSLISCDNCEDVNLGKLEFTNALISFLPAQPAPGKSYYITSESGRQQMNYAVPNTNAQVIIPAGKTNYSGKFDPNSCNEYYTAEEKVYTGQPQGESLISIRTTYRKDADSERYNTIPDKNAVGDVVEFAMGYNNIFPEPVPYGTGTINSFSAQRYFLFEEATTSTIDRITYMQEFLPTVTFNGVAHENVYHLYIKEPHTEAHEPRSDKYPLDFVEGIYIKEGIGLIRAYTYRGKQIDVTIQ
ncbi:hypothetical protein JAO76_05410 [Pontibacter sp. BT310]|uniref:DUF4249 domain-containing protein n=1 Tax=Pontibacter populi TaxID=890055 RepID=A0ABS6X8X3_9BACT|nr:MULTISPECIES: hypothetical protein [Pontibacter]MBJ6117616.1 hypothetical protein [Pontibacter sp. BT310]MBR0570041.1 hypothetical protein [Microvirga sp. STS03]MBW3364468.1 hypothetical protein [Pontibacter populi]